jgi:hypothetical protein
MKRQLVLVPTYRREAYLACSLRRIREQDRKIKIMVVSDRGEDTPDLRMICKEFNAGLRITPPHNFYGNSFSLFEAFRWAYDSNFDLVILNEDDAMPHPDCLDWHRESHDLFGSEIFAACGWVFNTDAPISPDARYFVPWYYSPSASLSRDSLRCIVAHANPLYYTDMVGYVRKTFAGSPLLKNEAMTLFFEQDAIIQFCLMESQKLCAWNRTAKVDHVGAFGYNRTDGVEFTGTLEERIAKVEELIADIEWRIELFGRSRVEREIGREIPKSVKRYRVTLPDGWSSEFESENSLSRKPIRVNSAPVENGSFELI